MTLAGGLLWALVIFTIGMMNLIWPGYGNAFLDIMASLYPGYEAKPLIGDVIVGTLYAFVEGAFCGLIFGLLYNLFISKKEVIIRSYH
jgi:hypothetical protein